MMQRCPLHRNGSGNPSTVECSTTSSMQKPIGRRRTRRQWLTSARSLLLLSGYSTLLLCLTYRNLRGTIVVQSSRVTVPASSIVEQSERFLRSSATSPSVSPRNHPHNHTLRYLSFDTNTNNTFSFSWPNHRRIDTSIHQAAACLQSLLGTAETYDVITIPYDQWTESHTVLTRRLRKRFPDATVVLLPRQQSQLLLHPTNRTWREWKQRSMVHRLLDDDDFVSLSEAMANAVSITGYWQLADLGSPPPVNMEDDPLLHVVRLDPGPLQTVDDIARYLQLFQHDEVLSDAGRRRLAAAVERVAVIDRTIHRLPTTTLGTGDWGSGDACHILASESNGNELPMTGGQRLHLENGQTAIKFHQTKLSGNSITIHNPFSTQRLLFLTYLTDADSMVYAKTRISVNGRATCILLPYHDDTNTTDDVPRTTAIGTLPPHQSSIIVVHPDNAWLPFVLLGMSIIAEEALQLSDLEYAFLSTTTIMMQ